MFILTRHLNPDLALGLGEIRKGGGGGGQRGSAHEVGATHAGCGDDSGNGTGVFIATTKMNFLQNDELQADAV